MLGVFPTEIDELAQTAANASRFQQILFIEQDNTLRARGPTSKGHQSETGVSPVTIV